MRIKDKPDELAKKANELRPTIPIPATYLTNVGNFDVDTDVFLYPNRSRPYLMLAVKSSLLSL